MTFDLDELKITEPQLEQLTGLDIDDAFMGGTIRPSALQSTPQLLSLVVNEGLVLAVVFIICLGFSLVIARSWSGFSNLALLVGVAIATTAAVAVIWHLYQWRCYQSLRPLAHLLDEVDRHNSIIQAIQVMHELETAQANTATPTRPEIVAALQSTRDSLVAALRVEKIMRHHRQLIHQRQEFLSSIETNLTTLKTLHIENQAAEYQQFLQEALDIGLAVQQELKKSSCSSL